MIEIDWLIHYKCNYRCPYCFFEGQWQEVEKRNNYFNNDKWVEAYKRLYDKSGGLKLIITGGEVFLYPDFLGLIIELNRFSHISFDTNLSCSSDVIKALIKGMDPKTTFMGLSYHPLFSNINEFIAKTTML